MILPNEFKALRNADVFLVHCEVAGQQLNASLLFHRPELTYQLNGSAVTLVEPKKPNGYQVTVKLPSDLVKSGLYTLAEMEILNVVAPLEN